MTKYKIAGLVALTLFVLGVVGLKDVKADQSFWDKVAEVVGIRLADRVSVPNEEQINNPIMGAVTGSDLPNPSCVNGLCTYVATGSFIDASTTILSIPSPLLTPTSTGDTASVVVKTDGAGIKYRSVTTTVEYAKLNITGVATTSYSIICGASNNPVVAYPTYVLVSSTNNYEIPTSTPLLIENNLATTGGAGFGGGAIDKIVVNAAYPYFNCIVKPSVAEGFTNGSNTFDGKYSVRFTWIR